MRMSKEQFPERMALAMTTELMDAIDNWRRQHPRIPPRAAAARMLIELALKQPVPSEQATEKSPARKAPARKRPARLAMARGELVMAGDG
jgi:hypothetical protein